MFNFNLKTALSRGVVKVKFVKMDQTVREMVCTTNADYFDYEYKGKDKTNPALIVAWDTENGGFRSFYEDRVLEWSVPCRAVVSGDGVRFVMD